MMPANTNPKTMKMEQLMNELDRAKTNEKWLMDQNKEQKRKLSALIAVELSLKKEQLEVSRLKNKAKDQDVHVDKLRKDLEKAKANLKNEETQRAHQKNISEQRILGLEKDLLEFKNKFFLEKMLREQKEKELEKFSAAKEENKKLTLYGQTLRHQIQELTGFKTYANKKIEEQLQQLKNKDMEHDLTKQELNKIRHMAKQYSDLVENLMPYKDKLESVQKEVEQQICELKKHEKLSEDSKKRIHQLSKETGTLTKTIEDLSILKKMADNKVDQLEQDNITLTMELENHKKEAEKQRNIILNLETDLNSYSELKNKLQNKEKDFNKHTLARDQEIAHLRNLISESENLQRMQIIQNEAIKAERNLTDDNLLKARAEITLKNKIIQNLNDEIKEQNCDINTKNTELVKTKRECLSVKNQLEKVKRQLAETKITQESCTTSAGKDKTMLQKKLAQMVAEKDKLEKDLQHYNELVVQLQQRINVQEAAKVAQEQALKECEEEVKFVRTENEKLHFYIMKRKLLRQVGNFQDKSRQNRIRRTQKNLQPCLKVMHNKPRQYQKKQLEEKDKEIEELKRRLARRPDGAIEKLQRCQWDNRRLNKKFVASQGFLMAYEANYKNMKEENKRLTDELRKLKMECGDHPRCTTPLPPISKKFQSPSEDKSKDQRESRHTRFPLISTKPQCESENKCAFVPLLPISYMFQCHGRKIKPHPPQSL
ncbi:cilia- and flagella-associated protein 58-like [Micropterus dolomieu]|uniref:cilia- and flagella-associated protein 58-like n=1 Tax=Micropterus dolomieu TaxID=147949 RepID=UPI001E8DF42A|nr:cilia- and flagella-associated protein 58-like [Micropterus dolomieu]